MFEWREYTRRTKWSPCKDCLKRCEICHSSLPTEWEQMVAPCKCHFAEAKDSGPEGLSYSSEIGDHISPCPESGRSCFLRPFYINHSTREVARYWPCVTYSQRPPGKPCATLRAFFDDEEPDHMGHDDSPLIPDQDLSLSELIRLF